MLNCFYDKRDLLLFSSLKEKQEEEEDSIDVSKMHLKLPEI